MLHVMKEPLIQSFCWKSIGVKVENVEVGEPNHTIEIIPRELPIPEELPIETQQPEPARIVEPEPVPERVPA